MPVKDSIELGAGQIYFKGVDEPVEIYDDEIECLEEEYADDIKYITLNPEPITFTCESVEFNRNWTLVPCKKCGYKFPITEFYALLYGTEGWTCPGCKFNEILEEARRNDRSRNS